MLQCVFQYADGKGNSLRLLRGDHQHTTVLQIAEILLNRGRFIFLDKHNSSSLSTNVTILP